MPKKPKKSKTSAKDEEIASDSDIERSVLQSSIHLLRLPATIREGREPKRINGLKLVGDEEEEEEETAPEKRLRLAKQYIAQVEEEGVHTCKTCTSCIYTPCFNSELRKRDDAELDRDAIAHRLKEDVVSLQIWRCMHVLDIAIPYCIHCVVERGGETTKTDSGHSK